MLLHLAWFSRYTGCWIGEWCGYVPSPQITPTLSPAQHAHALQDWQQSIACRITPDGAPFDTLESAWDGDQWEECPSGGAVCLDVTRFGWPVGDHQWSVWNDAHRSLDWGDYHQFLQIGMATLRIEANQSSHRPIRGTAQHRVFDITGLPIAKFHGRLFGQFVWNGGRWHFIPDGTHRALPHDAAPRELSAGDLEMALMTEIPVFERLLAPALDTKDLHA